MIATTKDLGAGRNPFFVVMASAVAITVFLGFAPSFYLRSTFNPDKRLSILLHIHGFALSAWIILFFAQTILIVRGSPRLHRRLGWVMSGLAACIVVLMGGAIVDQMQRIPPPFPASFFAYDWVTRRRLHPANIVGLVLILMDLTIQPVVLAWRPWTNFANSIQRFVS